MSAATNGANGLQHTGRKNFSADISTIHTLVISMTEILIGYMRVTGVSAGSNMKVLLRSVNLNGE